MPFNRPNPDTRPPAKATGWFSYYVEAEKLMQIALVLPLTVAIGWGAGAWADHLLHQKWMVVAGIVLGSASGLYYAVQTAVAAEKSSLRNEKAQNGTEKGNSGDPK